MLFGPMAEDMREQFEGARSAANPGARLLEAAAELFYERGYHATGINDMIARSGTSKKSFYNYYEGKRELGEAYLAKQSRDWLSFLGRLAERHRGNPERFFATWAGALKRQASSGDFHGCPFAGMAAQESQVFAPILAQTMADFQKCLTRFLRDLDPGLSQADATKLTNLIGIQYEGAVQMWKLTRDLSFFDLFARHSQSLCEKGCAE